MSGATRLAVEARRDPGSASGAIKRIADQLAERVLSQPIRDGHDGDTVPDGNMAGGARPMSAMASFSCRYTANVKLSPKPGDHTIRPFSNVWICAEAPGTGCSTEPTNNNARMPWPIYDSRLT